MQKIVTVLISSYLKTVNKGKNKISKMEKESAKESPLFIFSMARWPIVNIGHVFMIKFWQDGLLARDVARCSNEPK